MLTSGRATSKRGDSSAVVAHVCESCGSGGNFVVITEVTSALNSAQLELEATLRKCNTCTFSSTCDNLSAMGMARNGFTSVGGHGFLYPSSTDTTATTTTAETLFPNSSGGSAGVGAACVNADCENWYKRSVLALVERTAQVKLDLLTEAATQRLGASPYLYNNNNDS